MQQLSNSLKDIKLEVSLTLEDIFHGTKEIEYYKSRNCQVCFAPCETKSACEACNGTGIILEKVTKTIKIPYDIQDGQSLRFNNGPSTNLIIEFNIQKHPVFGRDLYFYGPHHLYTRKPVYLCNRIYYFGGSIEIIGIDGEKIELKIFRKHWFKSYSPCIVVYKHGMKISDAQTRGNLYVTVSNKLNNIIAIGFCILLLWGWILHILNPKPKQVQKSVETWKTY